MREVINVLIIDDDPMVSHLNCKYTEMVSGFKVINEINIDNEMIINKEDLKGSDLLLLDIYLPGKNGIELLKELRDSEESIDIIIISASKDTRHISEAMQWGVVDYLIKPFNFERLKQSLNDYRERKDRLQNQNDLRQQDIDSLMGKSKFIKENINEVQKTISKNKIEEPIKRQQNFIRDLPKGLNQTTLDEIKRFMKERDDKLSTKELAKNLGVSRVTGQRYLKYMADEGIVDIIREYGGVGRPKHYYKLIK